jgi:hypothetical protein
MSRVAEKPKESSASETTVETVLSKPRQSHGLGDFSALWELIASSEYEPPSPSSWNAVPDLTEGPSSHESQSLPDRDTYLYTSDGAAPDTLEKSKLSVDVVSDTSEVKAEADDTDPIPPSPALIRKEQKRLAKAVRTEQRLARKAVREAARDGKADKKVRILKRPVSTDKVGTHSTPTIIQPESNIRYNLRSNNSPVLQPIPLKNKEQTKLNAYFKTVTTSVSPSIIKKDLSSRIAPGFGAPSTTAFEPTKRPGIISESPVKFKINPNMVIPTSASPVSQASYLLQQSLQQRFTGQLPPHVSVAMTPTPQAKARHLVSATRENYERDLLFRLALIQAFPEQRITLAQTVPFKDHNESPNALHVFIDFSNIWIGFMEHLKLRMGMKQDDRLTSEHRNLSFESLVFLLERGRPVSRRVLVGSHPRLPAFDTAERIGYEINVLDKVLKARDMPTRQKREHYHAMRRGGSSPESTPRATSPFNGARGTAMDEPGITVSSSRTSRAAIPLSTSPERWVEQGVDEILQMKLMESLLDADTPATVVLATGDGAKAEYSGGFLKAVERALRHGWTVELVSWSRNRSAMYQDPTWLRQWGPEQFRYVNLDDFAEFLVETQSGPMLHLLR